MPLEARERAQGFFYTIRRDHERKLKVVPYSQETASLVPAENSCARLRPDDKRDAEKFSNEARRRFASKRLLCERRGLDGTDSR